MKKLVLAVALGAMFSGNAFAQIPVTDVANLSQSVVQQIETIAKWKLQYDQMMSQINQAKQQYESTTGSRNLGAIFNDPAMRDYLPADWQVVYDNVKNGGYEGLSGRAATVYEQNKVYDACNVFLTQADKMGCQARAVKGAQDKGFALEAYDQAKGRINQIDQLMQKISQTQDAKAIGELQSRIAVEQANIQNEQTKLQLYSMVAAAEQRVQEQRHRETEAKVWSHKGGFKAQPMTFTPLD